MVLPFTDMLTLYVSWCPVISFALSQGCAYVLVNLRHKKQFLGLKSALKCLKILLNTSSGVTFTNVETLPHTVVADLKTDSS